MVREKVDSENWETVKYQIDEILALIEEGITEEEIMQRIGIALDDWRKYKSSHPEIMLSLATLKRRFVNRINSSIYEAAIGAKTTETVTVKKTLTTGEVEITETTIERTHPPDVQACKEMLAIIEIQAREGRELTIVNRFGRERKGNADKAMSSM